MKTQSRLFAYVSKGKYETGVEVSESKGVGTQSIKIEGPGLVDPVEVYVRGDGVVCVSYTDLKTRKREIAPIGEAILSRLS